MQRIVIIHGWGGNPNGDWLPWANKALTEAGFEVLVPEMPDTEHPKIESWLETLTKTIGQPRPDDILIGHSIGCQTILRYLARLGGGQKINKAILIAPWWYLTLTKNEEETDAEPWLNTPVDFTKVTPKANKFICVFSKSDPWVPYSKNVDFFKRNLNPEIITKDGPGHFTADEGATKIDFLLGLVKQHG